MSLKTILETIFPFLFAAMRRAWDSLTAAQQQAILNAGRIGQLLKINLTVLGNDLVALIVKETGLPAETVSSTLIALAGKLGLTTTDVNAAITFLQGKLSGAASDEEWNGLLTIILNAGAILLSGGAVAWEQVALGIGQWAYKTFIQPKIA